MEKKFYIPLILSIFSIFILSSTVFSSDVHFHFGIKGGFGFTNATVQNHQSIPNNFFSKQSFAGGFHVNFSHVDFARIQIETLFIQKGFKRSTYQASLNYISFPILARFQIPMGIFTNLGFGITYLYNGTVSDLSSGNTRLDDYFDRLEYDLQAGLGWEFEVFKGGKIFVEGRLTYALNNISRRYPEEVNHYTTHFYVGFQY
ncbi:MAG: PorT family protein [Spirochaetota bacterium]|nr:PorT family protein [Spirochaetota bacterium]